MIVPILNLAGTVVVIVISGLTLYLGHIREGRSKVRLLPQESGSHSNTFGGGNNAKDSNARWVGSENLKLTNTGDKGAYISSISLELTEVRKDGRSVNPIEISIQERFTHTSPNNKELRSGRTIRYHPSITITPDDDVNTLIENDTVVLQYTVAVEDNKGAYEVTYESKMELTGPKFFRDDDQ